MVGHDYPMIGPHNAVAHTYRRASFALALEDLAHNGNGRVLRIDCFNDGCNLLSLLQSQTCFRGFQLQFLPA